MLPCFWSTYTSAHLPTSRTTITTVLPEKAVLSTSLFLFPPLATCTNGYHTFSSCYSISRSLVHTPLAIFGSLFHGWRKAVTSCFSFPFRLLSPRRDVYVPPVRRVAPVAPRLDLVFASLLQR